MNLSQLCDQVMSVCRDAGDFIWSERQKVSNSDIELKGLNSLVSYVDKTAEEMIVSGLKQALPEAGFITEEDTPDELDKEYRWVIDPLDGTTNYLHGIPVFAVSVALLRAEEELIGVVYEIGQKEMFCAWQGGGAWLNGTSIAMSRNKALKDTLLATGFPYHDFTRMSPYMNLLAELFQKCRGVRRLGSAATDLAYVACGRFDGFFEAGLNAWDVAAGSLLVKEAGGCVHDFSGGDNYIFGGEILSASYPVYDELLSLVKMHFEE